MCFGSVFASFFVFLVTRLWGTFSLRAFSDVFLKLFCALLEAFLERFGGVF